MMTEECINSVFEKTKGVDFEVILVDNGSTDGSKEHFEKYGRIKYIYSEKNLGFGRANNLGALSAKGNYLLLLNSDTILVDNIVDDMFNFMETHVEYMACGCNLTDKMGNQVISHGLLPTLAYEMALLGVHKICPGYFRNHLSIGQKASEGNICDTGYISGADIFIRKNTFDKYGGFDSNIFMYFEETDLFYRMKRDGGKFCVLDGIKLIHLGGASLNTPINNKVNINKIRIFEKSHIYYYKKNYNRSIAVLVKFILCIKALFKCGEYGHDTVKVLSIIVNS